MAKASKETSRRKASGKSCSRPRVFAIPKKYQDAGPYAIWQPNGPGRMLAQLANEDSLGEITLRAEQLADLVEQFEDEPLPPSLRRAVVGHLRGKRLRRQGVSKSRQTALERIQLFVLPLVYDDALNEANKERKRLKESGRKQGRYDDPNRLPSASALACDMVRACLSTFAEVKNGRLLNMVTEERKRREEDK